MVHLAIKKHINKIAKTILFLYNNIGEIMDGILVVDKGENYTSRDVVNIISKKLQTKKVGHTGTLDPMATGVLVVLIGKYTTLVENITAYEKKYQATIELGLLTDTLDRTGNVLKDENVYFKEDEIKEVLNSMVGYYEQEVPIYSAVKVNGKKLYEYARNGEKVTLPKRMVKVSEIALSSKITYKNNHVIFDIVTMVSKGTYIRALINDIAKKLNTYGTMNSLRRIKQGVFDIKDAYKLEDILEDNYEFYPLEKCFNTYTVDVDDDLYFKIKNGRSLPNIYGHSEVLFKYNNKIIALYKAENNTLKMWKYLI